MADKEIKKKLISEYKERVQTGGVFMIRNRENGRLFLDATADLTASSNRFNFSRQMGSCAYNGSAQLSRDWAKLGAAAFDFEIAETLDKNELQSPEEFQKGLGLLKAMWLEKFDAALLY